MTKLMTALIALALFVPAMAFAQNNQPDTRKQAQQQEDNQAAMNQVDGSNTSPVHEMSGMVGDNGKTFTSNNTVWHVSNPDALKNYANQNVTIKFWFNTGNNTIKINKVESGQ